MVKCLYLYTRARAPTELSPLSGWLRILCQETSGLATEILARYQPTFGNESLFNNSCLDIAYDHAPIWSICLGYRFDAILVW